MTEQVVNVAIMMLAAALSVQGFFTLYLMLYTWWEPERLARSSSPPSFSPAQISFTALLPARHEEAVIAQTIQRVWNANYPKQLLEVIVVCEHDDVGTIQEAERALAAINHPNARLAVFNEGPINKPHGLNVALRQSCHEVVTIFDAEDDVHPDIFQIINTTMHTNGASIVQAGVQLMDFKSSWFAAHNVLEYFFWFKSRLHFHAKAGMIPLGGNTVFMRRNLVEQIGGWDEQCLTEDADIGIRLSVVGEQIAVTYDAEHATREETPPTVASFIKQRTRWNQGFLQVLRKGDWKLLPTARQRLLAVYTLTYPFAQALIAFLWPVSVIMILAVKVHVAVAMLSFVPLYALGFQFLANVTGLLEFGRSYQLKISVLDVTRLAIGFLPYQLLLCISGVRAVYREVRGMTNWEKTAHTGAHRVPAPALALVAAESSRPSRAPSLADVYSAPPTRRISQEQSDAA
jgi:cellulose synthase/poly-beta-1,6-N-acetylglucosamine synthase-like glycosyltransferase